MESLEEFYRSKMGELPSEIIHRVGKFNVFTMDAYVNPESAYQMPYSRKDFFKIALIKGENTVHYADKTIDIKDNMLMFANPMIPYKWTPEDSPPAGYFCVFTDEFFKGYGNINDYPIYRPGGMPLLDLPTSEYDKIADVFRSMFDEMESDYAYKFDVLRNMVLEIIHDAMKWENLNVPVSQKSNSNAAERVTSIFMELLERQFPIESPMQRVQLKNASDYADQLNIHLNYLNRVLKKTTGKTPSQIIGQRFAAEARALLKHTNWNINEIALCLGFEDSSYFVKFFKKHTEATPRSYRQ